MATAFVFVWLLASAGGARAAESFSTGNLIGAVLGTFFSTLVAVTIVIVCLLVVRRYRGRKGTSGSPVKTKGVESLCPLPSNDRNYQSESSDDFERRLSISLRQDVVRVEAAHQSAAMNPSRRLKQAECVQKLDIEDKEKFSSASVKPVMRQGETSCNERDETIRPSFSFDEQLPNVYAGLNDEETLVTVVGRDATGLGFNIYGNMNEGIFVREVLSRGPAMESGIISQGDRILSISISTSHMVLEDALTILSYASPYPVTLRIGKTLRQETLSNPRSGPSPSCRERSPSTDVTSNDRRSKRPSVNLLYRSQSLADLANVKASDDRSVSEFRAPPQQLKRTLSEFKSSPECYGRIKKSSALHRRNLQENEKERLYRVDTVELTLEREDLAPESVRLDGNTESNDGTDRAASRDVHSAENRVPEKISTVGLKEPMPLTTTVTNQHSSNEEMSGSVKNSSDKDTRVRAKVANQSLLTEEEDVVVNRLSNEDTKIDIIEFDIEGTVRCREAVTDMEFDDNDNHEVKNECKESNVSYRSSCFGVVHSKFSVGPDVEKSVSEHFDYIMTRNSGDEEDFDRLKYPTAAQPSSIELDKQNGGSEIEIVGGSKSAEDHNNNNWRTRDIMAEKIAVNSEQTEQCDVDEESGILKLEISDSFGNEEERNESKKRERIHQKDVMFPEKQSAIIHMEDRPAEYWYSSKQTTNEVTEVPWLQPSDASPPTKSFLTTLMKLFSLGLSKSDDEETPIKDEEINKGRDQIKRRNDESSSVSTVKTDTSNSGTQMTRGDQTVVVPVETVQEFSFIDADAENDVYSSEEDFNKAITEFMGITSKISEIEVLEVCYLTE